MTEYSNPLIVKLGIKPGQVVLLRNYPEHYFDLLQTIPEDTEFIDEIPSYEVDFIHLFFTSKTALNNELVKYKSVMKKNGCIWVSYPKATASIATDIKRDELRTFVKGSGMVDVKVCSLDDDWSAIKFMLPKEKRK